jgi:HK97 family phage portal protein
VAGRGAFGEQAEGGAAMSFLDRVLARPQMSGIEDPKYPLTAETLLDALHLPFMTAASVHVDEKRALHMPAVFRAVNLISSTVGSLPLHPYKPDENGIGQRQLSGNAAMLLDNPHPDLTPFELWELEAAHVATWGNGALQKLRDRTGVVRELWPICPWRIRFGRASDLTKVYVIDGDTDNPLTDREILHIPGFGYDGVAGMSPIGAARQGIGLALAAEEYGAALFGSGSLAGGILTTDQRLKQGEADALKERWKAKIGGLRNAHEVAVLDAGAKFQQLTIPPEDAQFLQSRSFQVEEIARIYGIPPHLLMSTEKATSWGTGIEQMTLAWIKFGLRGTWLTRFEQRVTKLLAPGSVYAKYALEGLLRGDSAQRAAFYQAMWNMGVMSTNEIRALEDMPPVEGGDMRYRPLNFGQLGTADTGTTSAPDQVGAGQ